MELLHMVYKQSLDSKRLSGIVACIQILSRSLSNLRKSERSAEVKEMLDMSVKIFNENWASARTIHNISGLVTADLLGCLSKVVKLSKYEDFKQYLSTCCSQLIEMAPISLGKNDRAMLWIWYLKSCKDILECPWDTNYTGDEELSFSHWMLSEVSTHALNNVPIPSQCNSGGEIATSEYDVVFLRSAVHSVILACVRLLAAVPTVPEAEQASLVNSVLSRLTELSEIVCRRLLSASGCGPISQWFFEVFLEQDDALCSCLLALQHIYAFLSSRPEVAAVDIKWLNSWDLFSSLVAHLSHDHNVLLDLMLSPETKFLEYFISVLHHIITNWQRIVLVSMLDGDLTEESESGISVSSQLVSLTNGFESLMTYTNDDDSLDNEADVDSFASDESCAGSEPSLNSVLAVLDKVHQRLCLINKKDISPFNNTPLLALLSQIKTLSSQYTVTSFS